jgi:hypothetical protein
MFDSNACSTAGDSIEELSAREIDPDGTQADGGLFFVPDTSTVGYLRTYSDEWGRPRR